MNVLNVYWAFAITSQPLQNQNYYQLDETIKFTKLGANTLIAPFSSKELCIEKGLALMQKFQLAGQILAISSIQFDKKTIVPIDTKEEDIKLNLNLEYTVTIYHEDKKLIIPFTKEQYNEIVKFNLITNGK